MLSGGRRLALATLSHSCYLKATVENTTLTSLMVSFVASIIEVY